MEQESICLFQIEAKAGMVNKVTNNHLSFWKTKQECIMNRNQSIFFDQKSHPEEQESKL